jgi:hypothetical protein
MAPQELILDVHGLRCAVGGDWPDVLDGLALDFAYFAAAGPGPAPGMRIEIARQAPDPDRFGPLSASFVTPRNVVFRAGDRAVVDYGGQALTVYDAAAGHARIEGLDAGLVHEAAYQLLLSRIGTHLDAVGLPRLHALALTGPAGTAAVLLPSGGGKSTLALRALREDGVRLISEDTPLLGARGALHPFVLRMGVNPQNAEAVGATRVLERMEFHPKYAVEVATFADRIAPAPSRLTDLVIGVRTLGGPAALQRATRGAAVGTLLRECVIGVGVYQGMEFVLQNGMRDTAAHAGTALLRARRCAAALAGARVWQLRLSRDADANWRALRPLVSEQAH